jgi:AraC-like DNA-binding protein
MNYMLMGSLKAVLKGFAELTLTEGEYSLYYVPENVKNDARFEPGHFYCIQINFHPSHLVPIAKQYPFFHPMLEKAQKKMQNGNRHGASYITPYIKTLLDEIISSDLGVGERTLMMEANIRILLRLYVRDQGAKARDHQLTSHDEQILTALEEHIAANLDNDLSVNTLADQAGIKKSKLQAISKRKYGTGIHEYVVEKRMNEAAKLLLTTNLLISDIVVRVSDMTASAFTAAFVEYYGKTPSAYRKSGGQIRQK